MSGRHFGLTSRTDATGISHPSGSRGVTQYYADNVIPLPSRSIMADPIPSLEPINLLQSRIYEARVVALLLTLFSWVGIAVFFWLLFFSGF
jgi:hypothetical protein